MKCFSLFFFYFLLSFFIKENIQGQENTDISKFAPQIATPNASAFQKFIDIPISKYTGVADISIPIYSVKVGGHSHDIKLLYHNSGIKVKEEASWVGLGWLLNVGGVINYHPVGRHENIASHGIIAKDIRLYNASDTITKHTNETGYEYHQRYSATASGPVDIDESSKYDQSLNYLAQVDFFSFNFCGYSGKFIANQAGGLESLNKDDQLTIKADLSGFIITDKYGVKYYFKAIEYTEWNIGHMSSNTESFYLTKIEYPDHSDAYIQFNYCNTDSVIPKRNTWEPIPRIYNSQSYIYTNGVNSLLGYVSAVNSLNFDFFDEDEYQSYPIYLTSIETGSQIVKFNLSNRIDLKGNAPKKLDSIVVFSKLSNKNVRKYVFSYGYFSADSKTKVVSLQKPFSYNYYDHFTDDQLGKRLRLDKVSAVTIGNNSAEEVFSLKYDTTALPYKNSFAVDHWGYYNGQVNNKNLVPTFNTGTIEYPVIEDNLREALIKKQNLSCAANRGANESYMKAGLLKEITNPTGGKIDLYYEPNTFNNFRYLTANEINGISPGTATQYRTTSNSEEMFWVEPNTRVTLATCLKCDYSPKCTDISTLNKSTYVSLVDKSTTPWTYIVTFQPSDFTEWNKMLSYSFISSRRSLFYLIVTTTIPVVNVSPYPYPIMHVFSNINQQPLNPSYDGSKPSIGAGCRIAQIDVLGLDNTLTKRTKYSYVSGLLQVPLQYVSKYNSYRAEEDVLNCNHTIISYYYSLMASDQSLIPNNGFDVGYTQVTEQQIDNKGNVNGKKVETFINNLPKYENEELSFKTENRPSNGYLENADYYDNINKLLKSEKNAYDEKLQIINSSISSYYVKNLEFHSICSDILSEPDDKFFFITPVYGYSVLKSNDVIESYYNSNVVSEKNEYLYDNIGQLKKQITTSSKGEQINWNNYYAYDLAETDVVCRYMQRDNLIGNVIKREQLKGNSQIGGYKIDYCNPGYQIYVPHKSYFWTPTGYQEKTIFNYDNYGNVSEIQNINDKYTTFLWEYLTPCAVAKIENASLAQVTIAFGGTLPNFGAGGLSVSQKNTLRSQLSQSLMTTYTYDPLIGMTSQTDPNGITTYYVYDSFGRLSQIKDKDGNVLKQYEYNYAH